MKVLVTSASAHGSTAGIAARVAERMSRAGLRAEVFPIDQIDSLDGFDAVVIGSAIHNRAWLPQATAFVRSHTDELGTHPVWLFSVSSVGETSSFFGPRVARLMRRMGSEPKDVTGFRETIHPRGHRSFAGAVERADWGLAGHLFLAAFGGSYGDHRDWADIDTWADAIAEQLRTPGDAVPE